MPNPRLSGKSAEENHSWTQAAAEKSAHQFPASRTILQMYNGNGRIRAGNMNSRPASADTINDP